MIAASDDVDDFCSYLTTKSRKFKMEIHWVYSLSIKINKPFGGRTNDGTLVQVAADVGTSISFYLPSIIRD